MTPPQGQRMKLEGISLKILSSADKNQKERMEKRVENAFKEIQKGPMTEEDKRVCLNYLTNV